MLDTQADCDSHKTKEIFLFFRPHYNTPHLNLNSTPNPTCTPMMEDGALKIKSSTWFAMGRLGPCPRLFSPSNFVLIFFLQGDVSLRTGPPPHLEWTSFPPLVTAVSIKTKGDESPASGRIGVT